MSELVVHSWQTQNICITFIQCRIIYNIIIYNCLVFAGMYVNNNVSSHLQPTLSNFCPLQVEYCDSNSQLVVDDNYSGRFRLERVNP